MKTFSAALFLVLSLNCFAQLNWQNVDSAYGPLPSTVHVYYTSQAMDTAPFRAFSVIADLKDRHLNFVPAVFLIKKG